MSITKLKQLKIRKSSGSLNTGVQTKINKRSGDNLERFNIHMGIKMTNILYPHPLDLPERGIKSCVCGSTAIATPPTMTALQQKWRGGGGDSVGGKMHIVSASRDSEVGGEGIDEESDQEGNYDSCMESNDKCALLSSDEGVGTPIFIEWCTCGHAHSRSCPLNPRNKGALPSSSLHSATTEPTSTVGTCSSKAEHSSDSPCGVTVSNCQQCSCQNHL